MIKMLQLLCCNFVMIKTADKPWQIIGPGPATLLRKKAMAQVFSCEFWEIYKNTFYYRTPLVAPSGVLITFAILEPFSKLHVFFNRITMVAPSDFMLQEIFFCS